VKFLSDDLNKKIKQITDILGQDNLPDNVQSLLSLLSGAVNKEEASGKSNDKVVQKEDRIEKNDADDNIDLIRKAKKVMDRLSNNNDPRINLLTAIKPFLNNKRQQKIGNCIKILHMTRLTSLMDEHEP
jgi:uncharacterized phage infection (PIP) family protein YhgE